MSAILLVAVALVGAALVIATRSRPAVATTVGIATLAACVGLAIALVPGQTIVVSGGTDGVALTGLAVTRYARLMVGFAAVAGTLLALTGALAGRSPAGPAAGLFAIAGMTLALMSTEAVTAIWAVGAASAAALAAGLVLRQTPTASLRTIGDALRAVAVAAALGIAGTAWGGAAIGGSDPDPTIGGLALATVAAALVIRSAAVPAHGWAARLADAIPLPAIAPMLAWLPVAWAVVTLAWIDEVISPMATELPVERGLLLAVALACLALGPVAAWIQEDLGHAMVYLVIAGAGVALLAPTALDPAAWMPGRLWLAIQLVASTGLVALVVALEGAYGTRRSPELSGWARRSPGLAVALGGLALAIVGIPGLPGWDARGDLVDATMTSPLSIVGRLLLVAPLIPLGRMLVVGLGPVGGAVDDGRSDRPQPPESWTGRDPTAPRSGRAVARWLVDGIRVNRAPIATTAVLVVAILALVVSVSGLGLTAAARGGPPGLEDVVQAPIEEPAPSP